MIKISGNLAQIAVGLHGNVWGINSSGLIFHFNIATQAWDWIPGSLAQIALGANGEVWGLNAENQAYRFEAGAQSWSLIPESSFSGVAVGSANNVWVFNSSEDVYQFNPQTLSWNQISKNLNVTGISAGFDGATWVLDTRAFTLRLQPQDVNVPNEFFYGITSIAVASDAVIWAVNAYSGDVYQYW